MWKEFLLLAILAWNIITFFLFGWDKLSAKKRWGRVQESFLLFAALLFGSFGALFGMVLWNHKTSKMLFRLMVPLLFLLQMILTGAILY